MKIAFALFDQNGDSKINQSEFQTVFETLGLGLTKEEMNIFVNLLVNYL